MAKGNQHFVPRVYLKRWSPQGNSSVFYFEKPDLNIGQPRNVMSVLYNRHTYTINRIILSKATASIVSNKKYLGYII